MGAAFAFIGFGEAGAAFAGGAPARAYDRKADFTDTRAAKLADFDASGIEPCLSAADALEGATAVLSLVTADQALAAAVAAAPLLSPNALWFDMNSVAPETKRAAAAAIEAAGGRYLDVAVMSPVRPKRLDTPLIVSGPHADRGVERLREMGFTTVRAVSGEVGAASAIKMIRSVMVKGMEALTAECVLAADAAGVLDEVLASLDASEKPRPWIERFDYNLDRMMVHGQRRAAEMYEVTQTLRALGIAPMMSESTVNWQQGIGELAIDPPEGLPAKLAALAARRKELGA